MSRMKFVCGTAGSSLGLLMFDATVADEATLGQRSRWVLGPMTYFWIPLIVGTVPRNGRVWVFTDGTKVGWYCAEEVLRLVAPYRFCRWIQLIEGQKPTDSTKDQLRELFE